MAKSNFLLHFIQVSFAIPLVLHLVAASKAVNDYSSLGTASSSIPFVPRLGPNNSGTASSGIPGFAISTDIQEVWGVRSNGSNGYATSNSHFKSCSEQNSKNRNLPLASQAMGSGRSKNRTIKLRGGGVYETTTKWIGASPKRCWITLAAAIAIEIYATTLMKIASDESSVKKTILSSLTYISSLLLFGFSLAQIDVSVAYAIWSALGTLCVSVAGVTLFGEVCTTTKVVSMMLILLGVAGLNLKGGAH